MHTTEHKNTTYIEFGTESDLIDACGRFIEYRNFKIKGSISDRIWFPKTSSFKYFAKQKLDSTNDSDSHNKKGSALTARKQRFSNKRRAFIRKSLGYYARRRERSITGLTKTSSNAIDLKFNRLHDKLNLDKSGTLEFADVTPASSPGSTTVFENGNLSGNDQNNSSATTSPTKYSSNEQEGSSDPSSC